MIELLNIDCMEHMRLLPDKVYDLAIVDPPYFEGPNKRVRDAEASAITAPPKLFTTPLIATQLQIDHE